MLFGCPPRGLWRCSSQWRYLIGMLHFETLGDFMRLWGPLQVGGAALQPMVSQCCPSEVQAPVTTTELSWVVTLLCPGSQKLRRAFLLLNDTQTKKSASTWLSISNPKLKGSFCTGGARRWHKDKSLACLMTHQAEHWDFGGLCGAKFQPEAHAKALL